MVTPGNLNRRAALFEQLAALLAAGVPLPKAMEMAGRNRAAGISQRTLQELTRLLQEGHTFTDAMQLVTRGGRAGPGLSEFDVAMLSAGEQTGRLDSTFRLLARDYASRAALIRDTIAQTVVTMLTLHVFLLVFPLSFLVAFVLGVINGDFRMCVPFLVEKVAAFGTLYAVIWSLAFAGQSTHGEGWRGFVEEVFSIVPVLRTAIKYLTTARLSMALNALTGAGVPVITSWELAARACGSPHLKRQILRWTPELETGTTPAEMVAQIRYFPDMFTQLYQSGEISGRLDDTLSHLQTYFHDEGFRKLQAFCRIVSFGLYFTIAITVGIFIIRFYMDYFTRALNAF